MATISKHKPEGMSFYAVGLAPSKRDSIRKSAFEMQQVCRYGGVRTYMADNLIAVARNLGFTRDHTFLTAAVGAFQEPEDQHKLWRLHTYCWAISTALGLEGALVECGVYKGLYAVTALGTLGTAITPERDYYLYDTFQGLDNRYASEMEMRMSAPEFAGEGLEAQVRKRFAPWANVHVVAGTVPDVLADTAPDRVAFLHLDMNCAEAEIAALEFFYDRIPVGGVILLDDYGRSEYEPMFDAYQAWFGARSHRILELPTGQGLIVKHRAG
jgi:O-methyltransferase